MPAKQQIEAGTNVKYTIEGDEIVIRCKLTEEHGDSKSGKTITVAATGGSKLFVAPNGDNLMLQVNVNKKKVA